MASSAVRRATSGLASLSLLVDLSAAKTARSSVWAVAAGVKRSSVFIVWVVPLTSYSGFGRLLRVLPFAVGDGGAGFAVGFAAALGFAFVPILFALGDGQFALHATITKVKAGGDERMSFELRLSD